MGTKLLDSTEVDRINSLLDRLKSLYDRMTPPMRANILETTGYDLAMEAEEIKEMLL